MNLFKSYRYTTDINGIRLEEFDTLFRLFCKHSGFDYEMIEVLREYFLECKEDPIKYKKFMHKYHNSNKDQLYYDIAKFTTHEETIMFAKGFICRLHEWFLLSDKELRVSKQDYKPVIIDNEESIFDITNLEYKYDIINLSESNIDNIKSYLGEDFVDLDVSEVLDKADAIFSYKYHKEIVKMVKKTRNMKYYSKISNKSAGFYDFEGIDSYKANIFEYDTDMFYKVLSDTSNIKDRIKLPGNYDYMKFNVIKNKSMGLRTVFFCNSQVNSFLKAFEPIFAEFGTHPHMGMYRQNQSIKRMRELIEKQNSDFSILSIDYSKYSDLLPVALIYRMLNNILPEYINKAICECISLPLMYNGELVDVLATYQGAYSDFHLISMCNLYLQCCLEAYTGRKIFYTNVTGDDTITFIEGMDSEKGINDARVLFAYLGNKLNKDKLTHSSCRDGEISYLKCTLGLENGKIHNVSGISPSLLFKNVNSINRCIAIKEYMERNLMEFNYEDFFNDYIKEFEELIRFRYKSDFFRSDSDIDYIFNNLDKIKNKPYIFGGMNYLNVEKDKETILNHIRETREYIDIAFTDGFKPFKKWLDTMKERYDLESTVIDDDWDTFVSEELESSYKSLIKFENYLEEHDRLDKEDYQKLNNIMRDVKDRRFDKYIPGKLTTDRSTKQEFEDKFFLETGTYKIHASLTKFLYPPSNEVEKEANQIIAGYLTKVRSSYNWMDKAHIDLSNGIVVSLNLRYTNDYALSLNDAIAFNEEEVMTAIYNTIDDKESRARFREMYRSKQTRGSLIDMILRMVERTNSYDDSIRAINELTKKVEEKVVTKFLENSMAKMKLVNNR